MGSLKSLVMAEDEPKNEEPLDWDAIKAGKVINSSVSYRCLGCKILSPKLPEKCIRCGYSSYDKIVDVIISLPVTMNFIWPIDRSTSDELDSD